MKKQTANVFFRLICLLFSALLALLTILTGVDLTAESERLGEARTELRALEKENKRLRAEAACALSLDELEDYALRVLGMQHCESEQIMVIEMNTED